VNEEFENLARGLTAAVNFLLVDWKMKRSLTGTARPYDYGVVFNAFVFERARREL
jgi:hypothetical protein